MCRFSRVYEISFANLYLAWARDEPPSPVDQHDFPFPPPHEHIGRPSDAASCQSSDPAPSRWWSFALQRTNPLQRTNTFDRDILSGVKHDLKGNPLKDRQNRRRSGSGDNATLRDSEPKENSSTRWGLHVDLPRTPGKPFTLSHTQSPGWDTPWSAMLPPTAARANGNVNAYNGLENGGHGSDEGHKPSPWEQRKKVLRNFLLTNNYVPLVSANISAVLVVCVRSLLCLHLQLFRFVNITFTTSALVIAIRIRALEMSHHVRGAVGASP